MISWLDWGVRDKALQALPCSQSGKEHSQEQASLSKQAPVTKAPRLGDFVPSSAQPLAWAGPHDLLPISRAGKVDGMSFFN